MARATQITENTLTTEAARLVDLNFCVDIELLEFSIAPGFLAGVASYESATDEQICNPSEVELRNTRKRLRSNSWTKLSS